MKFLSWILLVCFFTNAQASTESLQELTKALNDYQYNMTVEWDQKDKSKSEEFSKDFFKSMNTLFVEKGLSNEDVTKFLESAVKDKKKLEELKMEMSLAAKKANSNDELAKILSSNSSSFEMRGASWNGTLTSVAMIATLVIITALIAYQAYFNLNHYCSEKRVYQSCGWVSETECGWPGGEYTCWDTGFDTYSCSEQESCSEWTEK